MASKFVKLGKGASIFYCPVTKVKALPGNPVEVKKRSKKIDVAISNGHLTEITKEEFEKILSGEATDKGNDNSNDTQKPIQKMNNEELIKFYEDTYEVSEEDIEAFKALKKAEKVKFLEDLEEE